MATSPYEIIAGPAELWAAPVGTAFPAINAAPGALWTALGDTEGGITARHMQTVELLRVDQATGPKKAIRSEEGMEIETSLAEMTLENYSYALDAIYVQKWVYFNSTGANNALKWGSDAGAFFRIRTLGGISQSFGVTKSGSGTEASPYDITIQLATDGGGIVTTTASALVTSFNADVDVQGIVTASLDTNAEANTGAGLVEVFGYQAHRDRSLGLYQGLDVSRFALLARGPSPYMDADMQYECRIVCQYEEPEPAYVRDDKAVLAVKWSSLEDQAAATEAERFGRLLAQTS